MKTDYKTIKVELKDGVAVFTINNPPVNQMSPQLNQDFAEAINEAYGDDQVKAIVLTGTGKNFIAGADITKFQEVKVTDRDEVFSRALAGAQFISGIEIGLKPVVAAVNGNCLGGGLETAMACHYRVAAEGVNLGQPEVQIGVIPGAGGTQRLPRLIGLPNAIEMITVGKPIKSEKALARGLVDEVVPQDKLVETAVKAAHRFITGELNQKMRTTRNINLRIPSAAEKKALIGFTKAMTAEKAKGYIAPFKAIEAMEKGLSYDIEADIEREVGLFSDCLVSDVAQNLIGIFLNTRAAGRLPRIKDVEPVKVKKVAMLGGGVMGSGIINLLFKGGFEAVLWDINEEVLEKGVAATRKTFEYPIKKRKMKQADLDAMIENQ
ncbi:MAG: enoyl-CoA hydratase-related protein, partial [Desulfatiglandaceae bacterium]